jgi:hypothetical protein
MSSKNSSFRQASEGINDAITIILVVLGFVAYMVWCIGIIGSTITTGPLDIITMLFVMTCAAIGSATIYIGIVFACVKTVAGIKILTKAILKK